MLIPEWNVSDPKGQRGREAPLKSCMYDGWKTAVLGDRLESPEPEHTEIIQDCSYVCLWHSDIRRTHKHTGVDCNNKRIGLEPSSLYYCLRTKPIDSFAKAGYLF